MEADCKRRVLAHGAAPTFRIGAHDLDQRSHGKRQPLPPALDVVRTAEGAVFPALDFGKGGGYSRSLLLGRSTKKLYAQAQMVGKPLLFQLLLRRPRLPAIVELRSLLQPLRRHKASDHLAMPLDSHRPLLHTGEEASE